MAPDGVSPHMSPRAPTAAEQRESWVSATDSGSFIDVLRAVSQHCCFLAREAGNRATLSTPFLQPTPCPLGAERGKIPRGTGFTIYSAPFSSSGTLQISVTIKGKPLQQHHVGPREKEAEAGPGTGCPPHRDHWLVGPPGCCLLLSRCER